MTLLQIDLSDALDEFHPDDKVVVWSPVHREGARGQVVNTRPKRIPLSSGKAEAEVEPGPLMVKVQCMGLSDTQEKEVVVPDQSSVTLWDLLEQDFTYTPPVISEVVEARAEVREAVARVGSAEQVGEWAERSETAASDALTIKNSIPARVQSEVDTRVPPKVADSLASDSVVKSAAMNAVAAAAQEQIGDLTLRLDTSVGTRIMAGGTMIYGDTGLRNITQNLLPGWSGSLYVRRIGMEVTIGGSSLRPPSSGIVGITEIPAGFRQSRTVVSAGSEGNSFRPVYALAYSPYRIEIRGVAAAQSWISADISYITDDPWPSTLPGTPV